MSIRTIVEVNHDYIMRMDAQDWEDIKRQILAAYTGDQRRYREVPGIRVLGSRHHSETLNLEVK